MRSWALVATSILVAGAAAAGVDPLRTPLLAEDWEDGMGGWVVEEDAGRVLCPEGDDCFMRLEGTRYRQHVRVARGVEAPPHAAVTLVTAFRGSGEYGHVDASVDIFLDVGRASFQYTGGWPPTNNRIGATSSGHGLDALEPTPVGRLGARGCDYAEWAAGTWYTFVLHVDPVASAAWAELRDEEGAFLAGSNPVLVHHAATRVTGLAFTAKNWAADGGGPYFDFDDVEVSAGLLPAPQPTGCIPP